MTKREVIWSLSWLLAAPAGAFAAENEAPAQPPEVPTCAQMCQQQDVPQTSETQARRDEAASAGQAQSGYQLGASPASTVMAPQAHPYTQAHYQLGAGHQE
ncbi:MAG TPA: hypothetical protein VHG72_22055 [Polyangia bacterium]|nr:hypothetical protein [Polyangia bacterium]